MVRALNVHFQIDNKAEVSQNKIKMPNPVKATLWLIL